VVWWLAVIILPIMVSVHSVYGYIFGLQAGRPGWYNPFQAPYFVLGAIVSGFSAILIALAILRKAFGWVEIFSPQIFKGLGIFLGFVTLLYMYFLFSEWLTGIYAAPEGERKVFVDLLFGRFKPLSRTMFVFGLLLPFTLLFIQGASPKIRSIRLTVFAAVLIHISLWVARALVVLPTFYHPLLPWRMAPYSPTLAECGMVIGSFFFFGLLLLVMIKIVPVLELPEKDLEESHAPHVRMPVWKMALVSASAAGGVFLMALGITLRDSMETYHSPGIWISGIILLVSVPFQVCVLPEPGMRRVAAERPPALTVGQP
jgi:molybdopterin-containing oxidoreductase family membrane subunit